MAVLAADLFDRANNADLGASWTVSNGHNTMVISGNAAAPSGYSLDCAERYSGIAWPADQWAEAVIGATPGGANDVGIGLILRQASGANTHYRIIANGDPTTNTELGKRVAGSYSTIWNRDAGTGWQAGDVLRAGIVGDQIKVFKNNTQIGSTTTDSAISSGDAGVAYSSNSTTGTLSSWQAGDFLSPMARTPLFVLGGGTSNLFDDVSLVKLSDDNRAVASWSFFETAEFLTCDNFGFMVPDGATITNIWVEVEWLDATGNAIATVDLFKGVNSVGQGSQLISEPNAEVVTQVFEQVIGGSDPLWNTTWTPAEINADGSNGGINIEVGWDDQFDESNQIEVDSINIVVEFTEGGPPGPPETKKLQFPATGGRW